MVNGDSSRHGNQITKKIQMNENRNPMKCNKKEPNPIFVLKSGIELLLLDQVKKNRTTMLNLKKWDQIIILVRFFILGLGQQAPPPAANRHT